MTRPPAHGINWTMVGALGTWAAVVAAVVAGVIAYRLWRNDERREKRIEDAEERAQASLVAGWIERPKDLHRAGIDGDVNDVHEKHTGVHLFLRNASQLPVYDMTASFTYNATLLGTITRQVFRPNDKVEEVGTAWEMTAKPNHWVVEYTTHQAEVGTSPG
jgi:hypothetical protein